MNYFSKLKYVGFSPIEKQPSHDQVEEAVRAMGKLGESQIPDAMFSDMIEKDGLWLLRSSFMAGTWLNVAMPQLPSYMFSASAMNWGWDPVETAKPEPLPPEPEFEVNLMEALVGWKAWEFREGKLHSASQGSTVWNPEERLESICKRSEHCPTPPMERCSCGIYAAGERSDAETYLEDDPNSFLGLVYGWGRYVRAGEGWRAQYAYPKCFYLKSSQESFVEALKKFHVPIHIEQPVLAYSPEEDGYEYRNDEADWHSGANQVSDAPESDDEED